MLCQIYFDKRGQLWGTVSWHHSQKIFQDTIFLIILCCFLSYLAKCYQNIMYRNLWVWQDRPKHHTHYFTDNKHIQYYNVVSQPLNSSCHVCSPMPSLSWLSQRFTGDKPILLPFQNFWLSLLTWFYKQYSQHSFSIHDQLLLNLHSCVNPQSQLLFWISICNFTFNFLYLNININSQIFTATPLKQFCHRGCQQWFVSFHITSVTKKHGTSFRTPGVPKPSVGEASRFPSTHHELWGEEVKRLFEDITLQRDIRKPSKFYS